jgi:HD-like signal output (HDOD) protein
MSSLIELYKNVETILEKMEIPPRPGILDQIFLETRQEEPDFLKLAMLISEDMTLSASLIKTVNSPFFGLQRRVSSVQDALMLLGLEVASRMVAGILLRHTFPRHPELDELWDASLKVALLSQWLAIRLGRSLGLRPADAHTFGLFRDCGMAVMQMRQLDYAHTLTRARAEARQSFTEVERSVLGIDHAMVGSKLASDWRLSDEMAWGILFHHAIAGADASTQQPPPASLRLVALAQFADSLLQENGHLAVDHEWDKLGAQCLAILGLDEAGQAELSAEAAEFIHDQLPKMLV